MAIYNLTFDVGTSVASGAVEGLGFLVFNSANNHASLYSSATDIANGISPLDSSTQIVWNETDKTFTISSGGVLNKVVISKLNDVWTITYPIPLPPQNIDPLLTADFRITNPDAQEMAKAFNDFFLKIGRADRWVKHQFLQVFMRAWGTYDHNKALANLDKHIKTVKAMSDTGAAEAFISKNIFNLTK